MTPRMNKLTVALRGAFGVGMAAAFLVQPAFAQQTAQRSEKIEVTGTNIKRVDSEGPAPVEIITKEQIQRTGATNTNELMRHIATIDIFDQGELASNSPAGSGTATIRMRGFGENNVLVLLNGKRLPINALYDSSGAGAAVNINMIPIAAIERVEILKDGGSAIYGADAVTGVVNFITKKDYRGAEVSVTYGQASRGDGEEKGINGALGFGDIDRDRFNVLAAFDVFKRDPIYRKDREISRSVDFRRLGGGDARSSFSPFGNILTPSFSFAGTQVRPCPPENLSGVICRYDFNQSILTAYNGADRWSAMVVGTVKLTNNIRAYAQYNYAHSDDHFEAHPVPDFFVLPDGRFYAGRFMQGGPRITDRESETHHAVLGLTGSFRTWDWEVSGGTGKNRVTNKDSGYYNADLWFPALEAGLIDATVTTNDPALVESLKVRPTREGESKNSFLEAKFSGELMQMRSGPLAFAVGTQYQKEELVDTPDALSQAGLVVGSIQQSAVAAERTAKSVFAELNIPLPGRIEVQAALRYDNYPEEDKVSPKLAARWAVTPNFLVRASYAESFRAPSLKQLFGAQEQGADTISSPESCAAIGEPAGCTIPIFLVQGGNPGLRPEEGKTYNLGFVYDVNTFSAGIDFWRIEKENNISTPTTLSALQQGLFSRDAQGRLLVFTNLQNFAFADSQGIDIDLRVRVGNTAIGRVNLSNTGTYYDMVRTRGASNEEWGYFQGTYATPRYRNVFMANVERGPFGVTLAHRYTHGFWDTPNPATGSEPRPGTVRRVGSHDEVDLQVSFTGIRRLRLDFGVKNLLDNEPPFSFTNASQNAYTQMGFAELYTNRGRFYYGTLRYEFR
jgi:iron complex outermembrane recepter protein